MSLNHGSRAITDGLVLHLDAANVKSYTGSGTTWSDMSGDSNNATLINGPSYTSDNNGGIIFDGTDDYATFGKNASELGISDTAFTIELVINRTDSPTNSSQGHIGFSTSTISIRNTNRYFVNVRRASDNNEYFIEFHTSAESSYLTDTTVLCFTVNGNVITTYRNGSYNTSANLGSNISSIQSVDYSMANGYGYFRSDSIIYSNKIYNRVLSAAEVAQNFEAVRSRYGL